MWSRMDVLKKFCDGERKLLCEMKEGYKECYCFGIFIGGRYLFEILHTSFTVKTSKLLVKRGCF